MTNDDNDKAQAFFILNDADVVEQKVAKVLSNIFYGREDTHLSKRNCMNFLYELLLADANENHPMMNRVFNTMFHSGRLRMSSPGSGDFIDSLQHLIRQEVREQLAQLPKEMDRRIDELKRMEMQTRYNKWR